MLVPIDFYRDLVKRTGLTPVFMGQIADNKYTRALCSAFPDATFVPSRGALADFETLRQSTNVVPAVSTFSWLACWLSTTARNIFMPLTGLFNPLYNSHHDFAPADDNRFHFFLFPANFSSHVESSAIMVLLQGDTGRSNAELAYLKRKRRGIQRNQDRRRSLRRGHYEKKYSDIRQALSNGLLSSLIHYFNSGFNERRDGFAFDHDHYVSAIPKRHENSGMPSSRGLATTMRRRSFQGYPPRGVMMRSASGSGDQIIDSGSRAMYSELFAACPKVMPSAGCNVILLGNQT